MISTRDSKDYNYRHRSRFVIIAVASISLHPRLIDAGNAVSNNTDSDVFYWH